jgi:hypothetical protein
MKKFGVGVPLAWVALVCLVLGAAFLGVDWLTDAPSAAHNASRAVILVNLYSGILFGLLWWGIFPAMRALGLATFAIAIWRRRLGVSIADIVVVAIDAIALALVWEHALFIAIITAPFRRHGA